MLQEPSLQTSPASGEVAGSVRMTAKRRTSLIKKTILNLAKASLTFGILYYLYSKGLLDFGHVRGIFSNIPAILISFFCLCMTTVASVIRWRLLLSGQGLNLTFNESLRLTMIGIFFNTALPGAVSGDVVKGYYVVRQQPDGRGKIKAFATLFLDRLLGLSALVCLSFTMMLFRLGVMLESPTLRSLCGLITVLWLGVVGFYVFVLIPWPFSKKLEQVLRKLPAGEYFGKLYEALRAYESCPGYIVKGLLISLGTHITVVSIFILLANALGGFESISPSSFFFLAPLGLLVTAVPIAPAGLGTGHAAFAWLFTQVGSSHGADLFTAFVSFQLLLSLIGGVFYLKYRGNMAPSSER
jgi:uncharacterized protein (TIRG00374 family)